MLFYVLERTSGALCTQLICDSHSLEICSLDLIYIPGTSFLCTAFGSLQVAVTSSGNVRMAHREMGKRNIH